MFNRIITRSICFVGLFLVQLSCASLNATSIIDFSKKECIIDSVVDLNGSDIFIPAGHVLAFKDNGYIRNGTLVGSNTALIIPQDRREVFHNVVIKGSWSVKEIYSNWFDFENGKNNTRQIRNLFTLCSNHVENVVFIEDGVYWLDSYDTIHNSSSIINVPSNTRIVNKATFKALPNKSDQSFLFYFKGVSNCIWEGGRIVGDLESHQSDKGEQGFGIALRGAKNITIRNVICEDCWGDGINLQYGGIYGHNENILIENVTSNRNRRQGLSIEDGINVTVKSSLFCNTGSIRGCLPMKAIDIEPFYKQAVIKNITIEDCVFENNSGGGLSCSFIKPTDSLIIIRNIKDLNGSLRLNDCRISKDQDGIFITDYYCPSGKLFFKRTVQNIRIQNSSFMSALTETSNIDVLYDIRMSNVSFSTDEKRTWNYYCLSLISAKTENVIFDSCRFIIKTGSSLSSVFPSGGDWSGVIIRNSIIEEQRDNTLFIPCDVIECELQSAEGLAFVCCKNSGALLFSNNVIQIRKATNTSPFVFHASSNPRYEISDNSIYSKDLVKEKNLIVKYKTNKVSPQVIFSGNKYYAFSKSNK